MDGVELTTSTTDGALAAYAYGDFAAGYYALAPAGRIFNYSNPNYSIAGLIDEQLAGRSWADLVEQDLFAPLGMTRTVARKSELDANTAVGLGLSVTAPDAPPHRIGLAETWESGFTRPAGLVWTTPSDQVRLAAFLVDGDPAILDPALLRQLTTAQTAVYPDLGTGYGFGLFVDRGIPIGDAWYDVPYWTHGGITLSYTSTFVVLPEQRFAISILSNGRTDDFAASLTTAIATLVELPAPRAAPVRPFDPGQLTALAGTYAAFHPDLGDFELLVTRTGDALAIEVPALDQVGAPYDHALEPVTTRVWVGSIGGEPEELTFLDGPDGETYLRNRQFVGVRPPGGTPVAPRVAQPRPPRRTVRWLPAEAAPRARGVFARR